MLVTGKRSNQWSLVTIRIGKSVILVNIIILVSYCKTYSMYNQKPISAIHCGSYGLLVQYTEIYVLLCVTFA